VVYMTKKDTTPALKKSEFYVAGTRCGWNTRDVCVSSKKTVRFDFL
jgi:hypothetical protein